MTIEDEKYDIVVVGGMLQHHPRLSSKGHVAELLGGTAGCVIAGRLAEAYPKLSILLLEAGPDPTKHEGVTRRLRCPSDLADLSV